jgi:hypothetical protein
MRRHLFLAALLLSAPAVLADTITVSYSTTLSVNVISPNDSFWGVYENTANHFQISYPSIRTFINVPVSNMSITIPTGSKILAFNTTVSVPNGTILGPGHVYPETPLAGTDPTLPHVAPSFGDGTSLADIVDYRWESSGSDGPEGSTVSIDSVDLQFGGFITAPILDRGSNWA